jgi:hypothetical protein
MLNPHIPPFDPSLMFKPHKPSFSHTQSPFTLLTINPPLQYVIGYCQLMVLLPLFSLQEVVAWTSSLQDMKALKFNLQKK